MKDIITVAYSASGEGINNEYPFSTCLEITWAKSFGEVYCHHASVWFKGSQNSLFAGNLAKVSLKLRQNMIEKGVIKSFTDKVITKYLPSRNTLDRVMVELNDPSILDALCENGWTSLKGGKRGAPKSFPLSLSVEIEGYDPVYMEFVTTKGLYPFTISEPNFPSLKDNVHLVTSIFF